MHDLDRLMATESIRQLASRYAVSMDARDLDALVSLYVDDVRVGRDRFGRDALRNDLDRQLRAVGITILFVGNHVIDFVDANHARGIVYCKAEIQDTERWIQQAIRYNDDYERRDGHWYFVRRRHLLFYGTELGQSPLGLEPADWPANHTGRGTLPESLSTWRAFWGSEPTE
jgi:ketosteroid isomerase-like protein